MKTTAIVLLVCLALVVHDITASKGVGSFKQAAGNAHGQKWGGRSNPAPVPMGHVGIIVIGAGASGIAAATKLLSNGFTNVTILEAADDIGGRIKTIKMGANVVDLGAQWCHGQEGNVVYAMAKDKNLLAHDPGYTYEKSYRFTRWLRSRFPSVNQLFQSNGEELPNEYAGIFDEIYEKYDDEKSVFHGSLGDFFRLKFTEARRTKKLPEVIEERAEEYLDLFHKITIGMDGYSSWDDASCTAHEYELCEGDFYLNWKDKGYVTVFDLLKNNPGGNHSERRIDPKIEFKKEVTKISYNQINGLTQITCQDLSSPSLIQITYSAHHVISTVSLGVLKERHSSMFDPPLPQWKIRSIDGLTIGTVNKIYLEFKKPFWDKKWGGSLLLWRKEELNQLKEDSINGNWLDGIYFIQKFSPFQPNIICCWIVGEKAKLMEEKFDGQVKKGAEKVLRMFLGQRIPDAEKMVRSTWHSNRFFRGSYSNYALNTEAKGASCKKLGDPIRDSNQKPKLQFAGEATSVKHLGCVHGAIESGWREADRIIEHYNLHPH